MTTPDAHPDTQGRPTGTQVDPADAREAFATAERQLCGLVTGLARRIADHVRERAARLELTAPQATALRELTGPMTMRELADRMACEPSNATFVIDKLESQGLLERHPHPTDRRAKQLILTPAGTDLRERLLTLLKEEGPLAGLSLEEQNALQALLQRAVTD
ncbi:MarR family transcriptional regulator [Streptomyces sp. HU2014]|uniref:MarR family transcriptional regulator n=1 Tax=Streptomyces albireticuli TaxID=1940 RepID=A0A1Z2L0S7_9ACTN|nr:MULTISPECIES: MarR family transcriptional regulator [Streptomyces]ARZ67899.1 MarR family transcriptional regulator [Streptomyces albireticuli]UQI47913.1 MarR family transcriptional regulator [Streptomyces sp. HU2014]